MSFVPVPEPQIILSWLTISDVTEESARSRVIRFLMRKIRWKRNLVEKQVELKIASVLTGCGWFEYACINMKNVQADSIDIRFEPHTSTVRNMRTFWIAEGRSLTNNPRLQTRANLGVYSETVREHKPKFESLPRRASCEDQFIIKDDFSNMPEEFL